MTLSPSTSPQLPERDLSSARSNHLSNSIVATKTTEPNEDGGYLLPSVDTTGRRSPNLPTDDIASVCASPPALVSLPSVARRSNLGLVPMESDHTVVLLNGRRLPRVLQVSIRDSRWGQQFSRVRQLALRPDAIASAIDSHHDVIESNAVSSYFESGSFDTFRTGGKVAVREGSSESLDASFVDTSNDRVASSDYDNKTLRGNSLTS